MIFCAYVENSAIETLLLSMPVAFTIRKHRRITAFGVRQAALSASGKALRDIGI
jgi:hypothetical protein